MGRGLDIVWRDVTLLALAGFVTIVVLVLPHVNPPDDGVPVVPPGNVSVELVWPSELDVDIDLWVRAPGDDPVGYARRAGRVFNLLRDDLGHTNDLLDLNYENAFTRGIPPGEYVVNVHYYADRGHPDPVPVKIDVTVRNAGGALRRIAFREALLEMAGDEKTIVRFSMDDTGTLVDGSVTDEYEPLRPNRPQTWQNWD